MQRPTLRTRHLSYVVFVLLAAMLALPLLMWNGSGTAYAVKGGNGNGNGNGYHGHGYHGHGGHGYHGGGHCKQSSYAGYLKSCKENCVNRGGIIRSCARLAHRNGLAQCRGTFHTMLADCHGNSQCGLDARTGFHTCIREVQRQAIADVQAVTRRGYGTPACLHCCQQTCGSSFCQSTFRNSRFYRSYKSYGQLVCALGSPSGAFLPGMTDAVRGWLVKLVPFLVEGWSS